MGAQRQTWLELLPSLALWASVATACLDPAAVPPNPQPAIDLHALVLALVPANEAVIGRTRIGPDLALLTSAKRLIVMNAGGTVTTQRELVALADRAWGLATRGDGLLWTLERRDALRRIGETGPADRVVLNGSYVGIHSGPGFFLYQPYVSGGGSSLLFRGPAGEVESAAGALTAAHRPDARAAEWITNLMQCSVVFEDRTACWRAADAVIDIIGANGRGTVVRLEELAPRVRMSGEEFAAKAKPTVLDVWPAETGALWVLADDPEEPVAAERGSSLLWKFTMTGARLSRHRLPASARMLLGAEGSRLLMLSTSGDLLSVTVPSAAR